MTRLTATTILGLALSLGAVNGVQAYEATQVLNGLNAAVFATAPAGDDQRLFIVQQGGVIRVMDMATETLLPSPFLDISAIVNYGGEQGLLGLAFHPDYASNGYFYVYHSADNADCDLSNRCSWIARYSVSANPDVADPGSRMELLEVTQPASNHNGGMLAFGPDGYLYAGLGDGGGSGDPNENGQNINTPLGSILRLDVDGAMPYTVPASNPFVGTAGLDEIWAYGLRNPWRFSFDRGTGDLWIADVGQGNWEEIDHQLAGAAGGVNYGWNTMEGTHCYDPPSGCDQTGLTLPVHEYNHSGGNCSITGGYLYRGSVPELQGKYLFGDYCTGFVWAYDPDTDIAQRILTDQSVGNVLSFGEDTAGEVFILTGGSLWRLDTGDQTGVDLLPNGLRFAPATPNPFTERSRVALSLDAPRARLDVGIYAVDGRRLRTLRAGPAAAGTLDLSWDGRDDAGRKLPAGVYLLRAETEKETNGQRLTLIR